MVYMQRLNKTKVFLRVDWERWSIGFEFNRYLDDFKIYLPVVTIVIWLKS